MAQRYKEQTGKRDAVLPQEIEQLDFEFVLFSSAIIDYDYIMRLIAENPSKPKKQKMSIQQVEELIASSSDLVDEKEDIIEYIRSLDWNKHTSVDELKTGYQAFCQEKTDQKLTALSGKHGISSATLSAFVNEIMDRMIFDGEKLTDLLEPLDLNWKERRIKELALMEDLMPLLKKLAKGKEISGLKAYE